MKVLIWLIFAIIPIADVAQSKASTKPTLPKPPIFHTWEAKTQAGNVKARLRLTQTIGCQILEIWRNDKNWDEERRVKKVTLRFGTQFYGQIDASTRTALENGEPAIEINCSEQGKDRLTPQEGILEINDLPRSLEGSAEGFRQLIFKELFPEYYRPRPKSIKKLKAVPMYIGTALLLPKKFRGLICLFSSQK